MKKVLVICLSMLMLFNMSVVAFAAGGFVESPSNNPAPEIVEGTPEAEDCTAQLVITPYSKRNTLDTEDKADIEESYSDIKNATDLTTLCADLGDVAKEKNIPVAHLAVSDLFDLDYTNCNHQEHKDEHGYFTIKLEADTLKNFVALLHDNDGTWEHVENARVEGEYIIFKVKDFSPFAIVVDTSKVAPPTGDGMTWFFGVMTVASAVAVAFCWKRSKKNTVEQ